MRPKLDMLTDLLPKGLRQEGLVLDQHIREGRFQRSLALIAAVSSILSGLEVTYEHYRSGYGQQIMYTPVILSLAVTVAGVWSVFSRWAARVLLPIVSLLTVVDGMVGFYFHVRGVARKPGGWRIPVMNVVMGPPIFAPLLFALSGYLGFVASFLRREDDPAHIPSPVLWRPWPSWLSVLSPRVTRKAIALEQHVREGRFQRHIAFVAGMSALFSGVEALYSHYKDNFTDRKLQWSPVLLTPALLFAGVASVWSRTIARTLLPLVSIVAMIDGVVGFYFHLRGVLGRPGGMKAPLYNVIYGPPVFAPLLFAASGSMGVLASLLRRAEPGGVHR
jgi:hypothetical protein